MAMEAITDIGVARWNRCDDVYPKSGVFSARRNRLEGPSGISKKLLGGSLGSVRLTICIARRYLSPKAKQKNRENSSLPPAEKLRPPGRDWRRGPPRYDVSFLSITPIFSRSCTILPLQVPLCGP